jgi:hypothetical protein
MRGSDRSTSGTMRNWQQGLRRHALPEAHRVRRAGRQERQIIVFTAPIRSSGDLRATSTPRDRLGTETTSGAWRGKHRCPLGRPSPSAPSSAAALDYRVRSGYGSSTLSLPETACHSCGPEQFGHGGSEETEVVSNSNPQFVQRYVPDETSDPMGAGLAMPVTYPLGLRRNQLRSSAMRLKRRPITAAGSTTTILPPPFLDRAKDRIEFRPELSIEVTSVISM